MLEGVVFGEVLCACIHVVQSGGWERALVGQLLGVVSQWAVQLYLRHVDWASKAPLLRDYLVNTGLRCRGFWRALGATVLLGVAADNSEMPAAIAR